MISASSSLSWEIPVINIKDIKCEQASEFINSGSAFIVSNAMSVAPWKVCEPLTDLRYYYEEKGYDSTTTTTPANDNNHNIGDNSDKNNFNIRHQEADVFVHEQDKIQECVIDFPIEMNTAQAIRLLHSRRHPNEKLTLNEKNENNDSPQKEVIPEISHQDKVINDMFSNSNSMSNSSFPPLAPPTNTDDNLHAFKCLLDKEGLVLYVKIPLNGCIGLLQHINLPSFLQEETSVVKYEPVSHPMLLRPCTYYSWIFVGEKGTGSRTHVDVAASDAWLVVLSGEKEWAMVHPMDKHLVTDDEGKFADLFSIDYKRFPYAYRARLCTFVQRTGDAVFVPSDAPHCVRNLAFSISITYNFCPPEKKLRWACMMNKMVEPKKPKYATVDVMLYCLNKADVTQKHGQEIINSIKGFKRTFIRAYVDNLPVLPTNDFEARKWLEPLHIAFRPYCGMLEADYVAGIPRGYDISQKDHRILYFYEILNEEWFMELFGRKPFIIEEHGNIKETYDGCKEDDHKKAIYNSMMHYLTPQHSFSYFSSHFGPIPDFLPLRALLGFPIMARSLLKTVPILGHIFHSNSESNEEKNGGKYVWHYSRFPWKTKKVDTEVERDYHVIRSERASPWCMTFLFYTSSDIHGPVSLHPLLTDPTLQSIEMLDNQQQRHSDRTSESPCTNPVVFDPHFELFEYSSSAFHPAQSDSSEPLLIYDLTSDMIRVLTLNVVFGGGGSKDQLQEIIQIGRDHGLHIVNHGTSQDFPFSKEISKKSSKADRSDGGILDIGLEKIMVLVLWFSCHPRTVGFTYNHTFSTVEEPATLCLTGSAASKLLSRVEDCVLPESLSKLCNLIDPHTVIDDNKRHAIQESVVAVRKNSITHKLLLPCQTEQGENKKDIISRIIEIKSNAIALCLDDTDTELEKLNTRAWKEIIDIMTI